MEDSPSRMAGYADRNDGRRLDGIEPSYSRPRVSDDNAFAEALFRTAKYRPEFPLKGFAGLDAARQWAARFVLWYNHSSEHTSLYVVGPNRSFWLWLGISGCLELLRARRARA
jgi:transposase InsO family protein